MTKGFRFMNWAARAIGIAASAYGICVAYVGHIPFMRSDNTALYASLMLVCIVLMVIGAVRLSAQKRSAAMFWASLISLGIVLCPLIQRSIGWMSIGDLSVSEAIIGFLTYWPPMAAGFMWFALSFPQAEPVEPPPIFRDGLVGK